LKITLFVFRDNLRKKELFGSANADVSKPWLKHVFIDANSFSSTLKHEIVHAVSGEFGKTIFKIPGNLSMALTEGIASAIDYCPGNYSNHYLAFLAYKNGYSIPVAKLFAGFNFFGQVSSLSYIYSGSFCKYLIDTFGVEKFKQYYSGQEFDEAFGKSIEQVEKNYKTFLKQRDYQNNKHSARLFFARPPIFKKVCARFFSEQIDEGWELFNSKDYSTAKNKFRNLLNYSGSFPALFGYISSLNKLNEYEAALKILKSEVNKYDSTSYIYNMMNLLGDQFVLNDDFESAGNLYSALQSENPSYSFNIYSQVKLELSRQPILLKQYISEGDSIKLSILKRMNSDTIFYASLPLLVDEKNSDSIINILTDKVIKDKSSPNSAIQALGILSLAKKCFQQQHFETAKVLTIKAIKHNKDNNLNEVLYSQLKKVNWMCNFADDTKSKFYFIN
jgi:predicted negative regulator of RcsB-dependent stress response